MTDFTSIFTDELLKEMFPARRSDDFFEALFGDANEGAFDIELSFQDYDQAAKRLHFNLKLHERPGRCLACNLTYGLPEVFSRHPIINVKGLVDTIGEKLGPEDSCESWKLGHTVTQSKSLHMIPLHIYLRKGE